MPHLQVDGHGSRFEFPFLLYVCDRTTAWSVCIRVPYGTSYWQVGDSSEQNGSWKMSMTKSKETLVKEKLQLGLPVTIDKTDIIPLCNKAWPKSFGAGIARNLKALSDRGHNPLNRALLMHPDILSTRAEIIDVDEEQPAPHRHARGLPSFFVDVESLNMNTGFAAECMDTIFHSDCKEKSKERRKRSRENGEAVAASLDRTKKLTAGIVFQNSCQIATQEHVSIVVGQVQKRAEEADRKKIETEKKRASLHRKVREILEKGEGYEMWSKIELGTMLQYHKIQEDPAMAKDMPGRREQWLGRRERTPLRLMDTNAIDALIGPVVQAQVG